MLVSGETDQSASTKKLTKHYHCPPKLELLMEDLGTVGKNLPRILPPPQKKKKWELPMEDLGTKGKSLPTTPPPPKKKAGTSHGRLCAGDWCVETNRCIPCRLCLVGIWSHLKKMISTLATLAADSPFGKFRQIDLHWVAAGAYWCF